MAALNITNVKNDMNQNQEISAQKKYKIELQAEINKLRSKYQDYNKVQYDMVSNQRSANANQNNNASKKQTEPLRETNPQKTSNN